MPVSAFERDLILENELIRRDTDVPEVVVKPTFPLLGSLLSASVIGENLETRGPFLELHFPVQHDTCRNDDKMGAPNSPLASKMGKQSDRLNCFTRQYKLVLGSIAADQLPYPSPISSARIPFVWFEYNPASQSRP